jgi:hypothetical protein
LRCSGCVASEGAGCKEERRGGSNRPRQGVMTPQTAPSDATRRVAAPYKSPSPQDISDDADATAQGASL